MKSFLLKIALLLTVVGVVACSKSDIDEVLPQHPITEDIAQQGEVRIVIPGGTRSVLEDNGNGGADLRWTSGDEIKLVARDASGADAFTPCIFYFWANKNVAGESYFRTPSLYGDNKDTVMPDGTYTYYAVSPSTATIDGTTAKFTLPATQNGEFSADVDFMVAKAEGSKLVACQGLDENGDPKEETDPKNNLPLVFKHKTHILRFTIPSGNNGFGQKVKKLHMIFPTSVAGTMAVDMYNGTIASTENTTNKITVDFAEPKDAGDEFYVMILPQTEKFAKEVDMRFEGVDGTTFSTRHLVNFENRVCSENKLTPVNMSIPAATGVTSFYYTEGTNNLGEDLWSMNITLPDGCYFTDFEQTRKAPKVDGKYTFAIFNDMLGVVENKTLPFAFESENALIKQTVAIGDLTDGGTTNLGSKNVPYLFGQDFSGIGNFSDGHDNIGVGGSASDSWYGITELSTKTSDLAGWYAARVGGQSATSVRICCRYEDVLVGNAYYKGRIYTPFLKNIKDGKSVKILVSFRYGGARSERKSWGKYPNKNPMLSFGIDKQEVVSNPDDPNSILGGWTGSGGYGDKSPSSLSYFAIKDETITDLNGSYTSMSGKKNIQISSVDNKSRLAWIVSTNSNASATHANYWLYLDDIQVSIAK